VDVYLMKSKGDCGQALHEFIANYRVMLKLPFDRSKGQTTSGTEFMKTIRKYE